MKNDLSPPRVALGVAGGIAAYKAIEILRGLQQAGCQVRVSMTQRACEFVQPLTFRALSGSHVVVDDYAPDNPDPIAHITFSQSVDLFLIAPATANLIAKLANGIADDFLTSTYLASHAPVIIAPAMNTTMWLHPATQRNLKQLQQDGVQIIEPDEGIMACGTTGAGRLAQVETIVQRALASIGKQGTESGGQGTGNRVQGSQMTDFNNAPTDFDLPSTSSTSSTASTASTASPIATNSRSDSSNITLPTTEPAPRPPLPVPRSPSADLTTERVVITTGATRENLDPVRFISNYSSGRMGFALAEAARDRGARVTVIAATVSVPAPDGVKVISVTSAADMLAAVEREITQATAFIAAAAVADYRPAQVAARKIKKQHGNNVTLELEPTPDILARVATHYKPLDSNLIVIGFAAETDNLLEHARRKLETKNLDAVVANDITQPGAGFDTATNIAVILTPHEPPCALPLMPKRQLADEVLDLIARLRQRSAV